MAKLIAGRFENVDDLRRALYALRDAGFGRHEFGSFYVAPPGQHALYPIGGDAESDRGAKDAGQGAAAGAALGGATGLAVGLSKTRSAEEVAATPEHPVERPGGPMVAVCVDRPGTDAVAIATLERFGAHEISHA